MSLILAVATLAAPTPAEQPAFQPVYELRQYKIVSGKRDQFIELFDREFVETQEGEGMELVGQFRDRADPDRFTWIRSFPDMAARLKSLSAFYSGTTWKAHRETANPMLVDNDNVLLLKPAFGTPFGREAARPVRGAEPARLIIASIHYLWKRPEEEFTSFFHDLYAPALKRAGVEIEAALVRAEVANNFPRLPVREGEKLFVWVAAVDGDQVWKAALAKLEHDPSWPAIRSGLKDFEERPAQQLLLDPTPRSRLR